MPGLTAQILITHPQTENLEFILHEHHRPAWILRNGEQRIVWIPTLEHMLEDGLLMIAIYVFKYPEIVQLAQEYFHNEQENRAELYQDITSDHLQILYQKNRSRRWECGLIISVFEQAHIFSELPILEAYSMDLEVRAPIFIRHRSDWNGKSHIKGTLKYDHIFHGNEYT